MGGGRNSRGVVVSEAQEKLLGAGNQRKFQFLREIASGGFGSVYLTKISHPDGFSRLTAVKLLHRRWSDNEEISRRMRDEARLLGWLRHRHIVDVVDLTSLDGRTAVIMEYLEAVDLKQVIRVASYSGERIPMRACFQIMMAAASALDAAFNRPPYAGEKPLRVIHRDIKPSNVMIDESGHVKVLDFGVARADFAERESHTRELQFGSVDYMPPERLMFEPESPGSDIYSLGATVFELLGLEKLGKAKGSPTKHQATIRERLDGLRERLALSGEVGDAILQLLHESLSYDPTERPEAAQVVSRSRLLARQIGGLGVAEWAEGNVPSLLADVSLEEPTSINPLTGRTFYEDSVSYTGPPTNTVEEVLPVVQDTVADDDPRWEALRAAAAVEMDTGPDSPIQAVTVVSEPEVSVSPAPVERDDMVEAQKVEEALADEDSESTELGETDESDAGVAEASLPTEDELDSAEQGLGPSLSASMTLGVQEDDFDPDSEATTMMPRNAPVEEDDATRIMADPPGEELPVDELPTGFIEDEGATRILPVADADSLSEVETSKSPRSKENAVPDPPVFEEMGGETLMISDDTKNLLESEAVLGSAPESHDFSAPAQPPPPMPESTFGSETILAHSGSGEMIGGVTGTENISKKKRFMASFLIFFTALLVGLGLGSAMFYEELYGEQGAIRKLFEGEAAPAQIADPVLPGPIGGPANDSVLPVSLGGQANEPAAGSAPAAASPDQLIIRSAAPNTSKLVVRCNGRNQYSGTDEVTFDIGDHTECKITAIAGSERFRVRVKQMQPGVLTCFANGEEKCE